MNGNGEAKDVRACILCEGPLLPAVEKDPAHADVKAHRLCVEERMAGGGR